MSYLAFASVLLAAVAIVVLAALAALRKHD
jgi:hypothetical protein